MPVRGVSSKSGEGHRAKFDGEKVILPEDAGKLSPGDVIIVFATSQNQTPEWLLAQEQALRDVWDNDEDAVYADL